MVYALSAAANFSARLVGVPPENDVERSCVTAADAFIASTLESSLIGIGGLTTEGAPQLAFEGNKTRPKRPTVPLVLKKRSIDVSSACERV